MIIFKSRFFILYILSFKLPPIKPSAFPSTPQSSNQPFSDNLHTGRATRLVFLCQIKARDFADFLPPIPKLGYEIAPTIKIFLAFFPLKAIRSS